MEPFNQGGSKWTTGQQCVYDLAVHACPPAQHGGERLSKADTRQLTRGKLQLESAGCAGCRRALQDVPGHDSTFWFLLRIAGKVATLTSSGMARLCHRKIPEAKES